MENMAFHLLKLSLKKHNDIDLLQATGNKEDFECFSTKPFNKGKKVLIIGAENQDYMTKIIEATSENVEIIILEEDLNLYLELKQSLKNFKSRENTIVIYQCDFENLKIDFKALEKFLNENKISKIEDYHYLKRHLDNQEKEKPLIKDNWADRVFLNVNRFSKKGIQKLLSQLYDLMAINGRIILLGLFSDERMPKYTPFNYQGVPCNYIPKEDELLEVLTQAGFHGIEYTGRGQLPLKLIDTVEVRAFSLQGYKGKQGICMEKGHAVFYCGPWKEVIDDDGHKLIRGQRMAVCEKTFNRLTQKPYEDQVIGLEPYYRLSESEATLFDCDQRPIRHPKVTKGLQPIGTDGDTELSEGNKCC